MRAACLIRSQPFYRADAFQRGLRACGYQVQGAPAHDPKSGDVLVIWNRYGGNEAIATRYEQAGAVVLVAENGYLGREWNGAAWYALARNHHNGGGAWYIGGEDRWAKHGTALKPWRTDGEHVLVLPQRGIGPQGVAMPKDWSARIHGRLRTERPIRVRPHPGEGAAYPLEHDLRDAWCVVTWGSGAAIKAAVAGVPVFYDFPRWIGAGLGKPFAGDVEDCAYPDRERALGHVIWGQWRLDEIEAGVPFRVLLQ